MKMSDFKTYSLPGYCIFELLQMFIEVHNSLLILSFASMDTSQDTLNV